MSDALALLGDWNATPQDRGRYSPSWVAATGGLRIHSAGPGRHGDIDFVMADCPVTGAHRYPPPPGASRSDHDVVMFTLHNPSELADTLQLLSWNLRFGRDPQLVERQLRQVLRDHRPDVAVFQEAADYHQQLRRVGSELGMSMLAYRGAGKHHQVILARGKPTRPRLVQLSPLGWPLADGTGTHAPLFGVSWVASWLRVVDVHLPPNVNWRRSVPYGPPRKLAAYVAGASRLARWARNNRRHRLP